MRKKYKFYATLGFISIQDVATGENAEANSQFNRNEINRIIISADCVSNEIRERKGMFKGNVEIIFSEEFKALSDFATIYYLEREKIKYIELDGSVRIERKGKSVVSDKAILDFVNGKIEYREKDSMEGIIPDFDFANSTIKINERMR